MAVLQRRDPALAADRIKNAIGGEVEVRVVNRQVCVILTPLMADRVADQLAAPAPSAPRMPTAAEAVRVAVPVAPRPGDDLRDYFAPLGLGLDQRPATRPAHRPTASPAPVQDAAPRVIEDWPPVVISEHEPVVIAQRQPEPLAAPNFLNDLPPLVLEDFAPAATPDISGDAGESDEAKARANRAPQWVRRLEGAVRDELDWYRHR